MRLLSSAAGNFVLDESIFEE